MPYVHEILPDIEQSERRVARERQFMDLARESEASIGTSVAVCAGCGMKAPGPLPEGWVEGTAARVRVAVFRVLFCPACLPGA